MLQVVCVLYINLLMKEKSLWFRDKYWKWHHASLHADKFQIFKAIHVLGPEVFNMTADFAYT